MGGGFSTIYFPNTFRHEFAWHSIEHNKEWVQQVEALSKHEAVTLHYVEADSEEHTDPAKDGAYQDYKQYIEYPERFMPFDFILVDGRARSECVKKAYDLVSDDGIVVMHDTNRKHYHEHFHLYPYQEFFLDRHRRRLGDVDWFQKQADM